MARDAGDDDDGTGAAVYPALVRDIAVEDLDEDRVGIGKITPLEASSIHNQQHPMKGKQNVPTFEAFTVLRNSANPKKRTKASHNLKRVPSSTFSRRDNYGPKWLCIPHSYHKTPRRL